MAWTMDDSHVVFAFDGAIYVWDIEGERLVNVTEAISSDNELSDKWEFGSSVSPDGTRLAFMTFRHAPSFFEKWFGEGVRNLEIGVADLDGSNYARLTNDGLADWYPVWSPDGEHIAFLSVRDGWGVYVMESDGSNPRKITPDPVQPLFSKVGWSADGSRLAFLARKDAALNGERITETVLYSISIDGSGLTEFGNSSTLPAWSHSGKRQAYVLKGNRLYTADANGANSQPLEGLYLLEPDRYALTGSYRSIEFYELNSLQWSLDEGELLVIDGTIRDTTTLENSSPAIYAIDLVSMGVREIARTLFYDRHAVTLDGEQMAIVSLLNDDVLSTLTFENEMRRLLVRENCPKPAHGYCDLVPVDPSEEP